MGRRRLNPSHDPCGQPAGAVRFQRAASRRELILLRRIRMSDIEIVSADGIATVTLNRPPVNALTTAMYEEIAQVFEKLGHGMDVHCAILTATGTKAFCAGKDLHEFLATTVEEDPVKAAVTRRCFSAIMHCQIPVIAAVNGPALGAGCVIASVCDIS